MVKITIEVDKEQNSFLNNYRVLNTLKTKEDVILELIDIYRMAYGSSLRYKALNQEVKQ